MAHDESLSVQGYSMYGVAVGSLNITRNNIGIPDLDYKEPAKLSKEEIERLLAIIPRARRKQVHKLLVVNKNNPTLCTDSHFSSELVILNKVLREQTVVSRYLRFVGIKGVWQLWELGAPLSKKKMPLPALFDKAVTKQDWEKIREKTEFLPLIEKEILEQFETNGYSETLQKYGFRANAWVHTLNKSLKILNVPFAVKKNPNMGRYSRDNVRYWGFYHLAEE